MWTKKYSHLDRPFTEYIISRWWRLSPVLFTATFLAIMLARFGIVQSDLRPTSSIAWWCLQPAIVGSTWFGRILPPAWSLDVEMQFYLIAPIIIYVTRQISASFKRLILLIALIWFLIEACRGRSSEVPRVDVWLGIFLIGIFAALGQWTPSRSTAMLSATGMIGIFLLAAVLPITRPWIILKGAGGIPPTNLISGVLTFASVLCASPFALWTTRNPSDPTDRMLGELAFPVYLIHWIPRNWFYEQYHKHPSSTWWAFLTLCNFALVAVGALALLFGIDRPLQKLRQSWLKGHLRVVRADDVLA